MTIQMGAAMSARLMAAVDGMPAFPKSVERVLVLTRDVNCTPKELVDVIDKDPVLTVKILKVVNSAYYSLPKPITSIGHAVVYLGFNSIKNLALSIAAIGMLPKTNAAGFDGQQYLVHSLATASIAKQLAGKLPGADPHDCFIAGLLHDFGKVVLAQYLSQEFRIALEMSLWQGSSLHLALREVLGVDHAVIGAMLAEKWRFPEPLVACIRYQHGPELIDTDMACCVFAANQISKQLKFGDGGNALVEDFPRLVLDRFGGNLQDIVAELGDLEPHHTEAQVFAKI